MNKSELICLVAAKAEVTRKSAEKAVNAVFDSIKIEVSGGQRVQVAGFGTFEARSRAARKGKNPQTGAEIQIPAATVPAFRAGKAFKEVTNGKKKPASTAKKTTTKTPAKATKSSKKK